MKSRIGLAQENLESVFEDEDEEVVFPAIDLFRAFPPLQEYLRDIQDPVATTGYMRRH